MPLVSAALLVLFLASGIRAQPSLPEILSRVAEEAGVLEQNATKVLTRETLEQRAVMPGSRFRPLLSGSADSSKPRIQTREVVSEYSVGTIHNSDSHNLIEFRQVISVDGRPIQSPEKASHALSMGLHSPDDRVRKGMLQDFAKHGLVDVATDYALILLAFSKRGLEQMKVELANEDRVGPEPAMLLSWQQNSADSGQLEFRGRQVTRRALAGKLWVRKSDGLPLRIQAWAEHHDSGHKIRDEATVDYVVSAHGFVTPAAVAHRHLVDGRTMTENLYRYEPFKLFGAASEIQFTETPDPAATKTPIKTPIKK